MGRAEKAPTKLQNTKNDQADGAESDSSTEYDDDDDNDNNNKKPRKHQYPKSIIMPSCDHSSTGTVSPIQSPSQLVRRGVARGRP